MNLRRVRPEDCKLLWEWRNDSDVRIACFNSESVSWNKHTAWFDSKIKEPRCLMFICEDHGTDIGQVRLDCQANGRAEITVSISSNFRMNGFGSDMICLLLKKIQMHKAIDAYIRLENTASQITFIKAGFKFKGKINWKNQKAVHMEKIYE